jgi:hypothetical protein
VPVEKHLFSDRPLSAQEQSLGNGSLEDKDTIFDAVWNFILPFAAGRYSAVRIFVWALLSVAAGLTFYFSG